MIVEEVLEVSRLAPERSILNVLAKLMEEVGELAQEVNISDNFLPNKKSGIDGIKGEAIDVIQCAIDIIYLADPTVTEEELETIMAYKTAKWVRQL